MPLFEVADLMGKNSGDLILALLKKGMVCNRNNILTPDVIKNLADSFGIKNTIITQSAVEKQQASVLDKDLKESKNVVSRWPIVVVMGHVDHGKTTLLDYVRKMNVAASEKGGITQHLGAYEVDSSHGKIVFLDTPGHEAFSYIRERGARVTDIVVLVIAADDGIKPQTIEAINHAKAADVPIIVAINKIDKIQSASAIETIKRQLAQYELMPEDWGGKTIIVPISAKTGKGVDELLELIVLQSQMMDLKVDPSRPAKAFVLESKVEKGYGPVATVIAVEGTLRQGDYFTCGNSAGRIRLLINSFSTKMQSSGPSVPVQIVGFDSFASIGDWLTVVPQDVYLKAKNTKPVEQSTALEVASPISLQPIAKGDKLQSINLIIKTDTRGSKEALMGCIDRLAKLSKEVKCPLYVISTGVGDISENDIEFAESTKSIIVGLHVKTEKNALILARQKNVTIIIHHIIYHLVEDLEKLLQSKRIAEIVWAKVGEAVVKKVFDIKGVGVIAGCYMRDGVLSRDCKVTCVRDGKVVGEGKVTSLQRDKKTVKEIHAGYECGFMTDSFSDWQEGDTVLCYNQVKEKKQQ
jgi:translation initiation factor IF-2